MTTTLSFEFVLEAEQPVAHHAEVLGNAALLMRRKTRQPDGSFVAVPVVTGDTLRHGLREAASWALLEEAGLGGARLTEAALRLLFAGGMVSGRGDAAVVKLDQYRRLVDLLPHLALFGGCAYNRVIPGRLVVEDAVLVCDEARHLLPAWVLAWAVAHGGTAPGRAHVEEAFRVRMDPALDPTKRALLAPEARAAVEGRLADREAAAEDGDAVAADRSRSTLMPRTFERLVAGSCFAWRVQARCASALDEAALHLALTAFLGRARVGGKRGTGHGLLRVAATRGDPPLAEVAEAFRAHVRARKDEIAVLLGEVDA